MKETVSPSGVLVSPDGKLKSHDWSEIGMFILEACQGAPDSVCHQDGCVALILNPLPWVPTEDGTSAGINSITFQEANLCNGALSAAGGGEQQRPQENRRSTTDSRVLLHGKTSDMCSGTKRTCVWYVFGF